ncbi:MAG: GAF domain-containing protein, partial [Calditrichia bacterium]|nr:GAF domain-containing protein [Calditrichia bacterium]
NLKKQIFRHFTYFSSKAASLSANSITQLFKDSQDNIWVGTTAGLNLYSSESNSFKRIVYDPRDPSSIMGKQILFVFEDQSGVLWIGTEEGLNKYDKRQNVFEHIKHDPVNSNSLCNNNIWIICEDHKGRLWFGTDNGMSCFNSQNGRFTTYQTEKKNQNSISHNIVRTIIEDDIGNLWIGTNGGGLNKLDNRRSGFTVLKHDPEDPNSISSNSIRSLYQDKFGTLWIGTWDGLDEYFPHSNLINHYKNDPDNQNSISDNRVRTIYEDRKGNFWIGTYGGLNLFDRDKKKFISYISDDSDLNGLSNDRVLCIHEDQSGQLWIGTFKGLNKFDKKGNKFYHYTTKNGLPNDVIYGILEDEQGFLWVSTNKGLSKFNPGLEKISFRNFNVEDGLQSNEFNGGAYLKMKNSELIFGGIKGVSKFSPENIVENTYIPPVVFTAFNIYNEQIQFEQSINYIQEITLSYKDDFFSLEFAALDYTNPVKNQYTYMLEGYNENWIKAGNRHYASYTNLDGGEYIFKVKGSNSGGKWNEIPKSVRIIIIPPFYATWSFRILIILLLGVIGFSTYKIKVRSIAKQREILKQQVDEQTAKLKKRNSALKKAENAAQQFAAQASLLNEVGQRVSGVLDLNTLLNEIVISARDAFDYYGVMLFLKEEEKEAFRLQSIAGGYKDIFPKDISIKMGEGMIGRAAQTHEIQLSNDVTQNPHYVKKVGEITCSELSVPIKVEDEVIAVLDIQSDEKDIFKETDVAMLETFSTQIEAAINNARLYEKSQNEIADRQRA